MTVLRRVRPNLVAGTLVALAGGGGSHAQAPAQEPVRVIIGFAQAPGPTEQALVRSFGGTIRHTYSLVSGIAAVLPPAAIQALRNNPNVTDVTLDAVVSEIDAELDAAWGVKRIGSGVVHDSGNKGSGVRVCVIDSGVAYNHPDLAGNYIGGYDFVNDDTDPFDDRGHGSHVTGSLLAADNDGGVVGVAPLAGVLAYKILDSSGQGFISDAIASLEACISTGGRVTNSSFGTQSDPGPTVKAAYDNAELAGLVNVAAAGNRTSFFGTCTSIAFPARYSSVIAVTGTDSNNNIGSYSCRGAEAELAAPGSSIYSTVPTGACAYCTSSGYNTLSGTSMASPHVAGVAGLVITSGITDLNGNGRVNDEVRQRLLATADDLGTAGRDSNYGFGLVDADEAAPPAPPAPPLPPGDLAATAVSSSRIDLTWTDNSSNESSFTIESCQGSPCSDFAPIATVGAGVTAYANTSLAWSTAYTYRVKASNSGGDSGYSNEAAATTFDETIPASPSGLAASAVSSSQINLTWADNSSNETGFRIERCQGAGCTIFDAIATVAAGSTSHNTTGLTASTSYTYRVVAEGNIGDSEPSNTASATTQAAGSITLTVSGYKVQGMQRADLTWNGATSTNVDIFRNGAKIATTANDGVHTDNINARGGGSYKYKVCEAGTTTCSNEVTITF